MRPGGAAVIPRPQRVVGQIVSKGPKQRVVADVYGLTTVAHQQPEPRERPPPPGWNANDSTSILLPMSIAWPRTFSAVPQIMVHPMRTSWSSAAVAAVR